jgi:hypothetical protein
MSAILTPEERVTLKMAAYGAVTLLSLADPGVVSTTRESIAGSKALSGSTGLVGTILAGKDKFTLKGHTAAEVADEVLPALSSTVELLEGQDPSEAGNFRTTVTVAVRQAAAATGGPSPAQSVMIDKIRAALGETNGQPG